MAKPEKRLDELINDHKPKNVKFKFIPKDETLLSELSALDYDIGTLDTINDDDMVNKAINAPCQVFERTIVGKAKEPTFFGDGTMIFRKLVKKADKKLLAVHRGFFDYENSKRMVFKLEYERWFIVEIFVLI